MVKQLNKWYWTLLHHQWLVPATLKYYDALPANIGIQNILGVFKFFLYCHCDCSPFIVISARWLRDCIKAFISMCFPCALRAFLSRYLYSNENTAGAGVTYRSDGVHAVFITLRASRNRVTRLNRMSRRLACWSVYEPNHQPNQCKIRLPHNAISASSIKLQTIIKI